MLTAIIVNRTHQERIKSLMEQGKDIFGRKVEYITVPVDETFPVYLRRNLDRFKHLIAHD